MLHYQIEPRFSEGDFLGHISNTVLPVWFEQARNPIFELFNPTLDVTKWNLIIKKIEVEYEAQIYFAKPVDIRTWIERVGNSSFVVAQQAWQSNECVASGKTVLVYFDYKKQSTQPIDGNVKAKLQALKIAEDV